MTAEIHQFMTVGAYVTTCDQSIDSARTTMREAGIRHLPVLQGGSIVGLISARDLTFLERLPGLRGSVTVDAVMTPEPYVVEPEAVVSEVVRAMARKKIGSAVVARNGSVIGIFTAVDALDMLAEKLESEEREP